MFLAKFKRARSASAAASTNNSSSSPLFPGSDPYPPLPTTSSHHSATTALAQLGVASTSPSRRPRPSPSLPPASLLPLPLPCHNCSIDPSSSNYPSRTFLRTSSRALHSQAASDDERTRSTIDSPAAAYPTPRTSIVDDQSGKLSVDFGQAFEESILEVGLQNERGKGAEGFLRRRVRRNLRSALASQQSGIMN
jgi:hypothetical protein